MKGTIREQILYSMVCVSILIMVILGISIFAFSKRTIENNYQESHYYNLQVSSSNIEIQLNTIVDEIRTVLTNGTFLNIMLNDDSTTGYFSARNKLTMESIMNEITNHNQMIQSMTILDNRGSWLFVTKNTTQKGKMSHYYSTDYLLEEEWVKVAKQAKGKEVFYGYNVLFEDENADVFSMVKQLIHAETGENVGYMVVNIRKKLLDKAFSTEIQSYTTNRYMIIDKDEIRNDAGNRSLVYFNGNTEDSAKILNAYEEGEADGRYLFSSYHNKSSNWDIVNVIERNELSKESNYIGWVIVIAVIVLIILSIGVANTISKRISRPLETLEKAIIEVGDGNFQVEVEFDYSEVGMVGRKFQDMASNNLELRERLLNAQIKEREAELLLLQSQINPHFLYNTLDSLYFMAIIKDADDIAEMVKSLSDTFKLSLNKGDKLIRVKDELEKIKAYMKIQNLRHGDRFIFLLDVEEDMLDKKMLSFILQPIVENSVYHGLEPKRGKGSIHIRGYETNDKLHFVIEDDGVGILDLSKLDSGYGVHNIQERIRLFYGEEYLVKFYSEQGQGTTASITLPIVKEG
ncbi:MAG: sensor histidine kinase [Candidatus Galacturonibacter soehngenii]|nr:sensor histidine kinase [Candidatus Galacturonibacter soehngenii]